MTDPLESFPAFALAVQRRLERGRETYGDQSFSRPSAELLGELEQEALDLAGWGFVLFERLRRLRDREGAGALPQGSPSPRPRIAVLVARAPEQADESVPVTVHLSPHAIVALEELARRGKCSRSAVVETALANLWTPPKLPPARNPNGEPYVTAYHGIPVTTEQRDEIERRANGGEPVTEAMVWSVVDPTLASQA